MIMEYEDKEKVVAARELVKEVFKDAIVEYTGYRDRFIFTWGEHHCECGAIALEKDAEEIARHVCHAFIELKFK